VRSLVADEDDAMHSAVGDECNEGMQQYIWFGQQQLACSFMCEDTREAESKWHYEDVLLFTYSLP